MSKIKSLESLGGKRVRFKDNEVFKAHGWKEVKEASEGHVIFSNHSYLADLQPDGKCLQNRAFDLIVHPDDCEPEEEMTREEIEAEIARLQEQLDAMPLPFPEEQRSRYVGWNKNGDISWHANWGVESVSGDWDHISEVKLVEIRRIR